MSEDPVENVDPMSEETASPSGRKRQKVRIKYRERIRIKTRPKGNKVTRYLKKHRKNLIAGSIILALLGCTIFMIGKVVKEQVEMNYKQKENKSIGF